MPSFHLRFVGQTALPRNLSQQDVDEGFALSDKDVDAIRTNFRSTGRLGAAVQLVLLRATGRAPDALVGLPKLLLQSLSKAIGCPATDIASLRSLYKVARTRSEHQKWAREHAGFSVVDDTTLQALSESLVALAASAVSVDDLVTQGELWLFGRLVVLPGDRVIRDAARSAFAAQEEAATRTVKEGVSDRLYSAALSRLYAKRKGRTGSTVLEWLRTPPGKQGQITLRQITQKIAFLKILRVHEWNLSAIPLARIQAYSREVVNRPPSSTERLSEDRKRLELCCFLHVTLLELTDLAVDQASRRVNNMARQAEGRVQDKTLKSAKDLRTERVRLKSVLYAPDMTAEQKLEALQALLPQEEDEIPGGHAAMVRQSIVEEAGPQVSALLNTLGILDVKGDEHARPMRQVKALRELVEGGATELPADFDVSMVELVWQPLLRNPDRKKALSALKACAMNSVRNALKGGKVYLAHSFKHRDREEQLISPEEWRLKRKAYLRAMSLTEDVEKYLERVQQRLDESLSHLAKAAEEGVITIDQAGVIHIDPIYAADEEPQVSNTLAAMFSSIGKVQQGAMLVEIDAKTGFSAALLGRKAKDINELKALYGALMAHGSENDAKGIAAMIRGLQVSQITAAMRQVEARGRLRDASDCVLSFQQNHEIAMLWGKGDKGSADSMTLDVSRYLHMARMEHRRKQPGVGIYVHVRDSWGIFYDQHLVINDRQAAVAVQGVEAHNAKCREDQVKMSLLAVDTHGYTAAAMSIAKLLGFDLCVRLRQMSERKLYLPRGRELPEALERAKIGKVSMKKIREGWDELLRLVVSIREGRLTAREALERFGSAAQGQKMHAAAEELGKLLRTIFLCDYFSKPHFRREMHTLLNRNESVHQLQRAVHFGRIGTQRGRRHDEMVAISGSHALLTNIVIAWNTMKMQEVADQRRALKDPIPDEWLRRMGPVHFGHINFRGVISFDFERFADSLLQRQARSRSRAAA